MSQLSVLKSPNGCVYARLDQNGTSKTWLRDRDGLWVGTAPAEDLRRKIEAELQKISG